MNALKIYCIEGSRSLLKQLFLLFLTVFLFSENADAQLYKAHLSGNNEVLPAVTEASGMVWAHFDGTDLKVWGDFDDLMGDFDASIAGGSHIHMGLAGENGGIQYGLTPVLDIDQRGGSYDSLFNTFTLTPSEVDALMNHGLYVNIHTTEFPGGELRAQLLPADADHIFTINAFGSNEVHQVVSNAHGAFNLEVEGTTLRVSGAFDNLHGDFDASIAGGIHLHNALAGENGAINIFLNADPAMDLKSGIVHPDSNTFTLSPSQMTALMNREMYVNIHTTTQPAGELRGQTLMHPQIEMRAFLSGTNEQPIATTMAHGQVAVEIWGDTIALSGRFDDLSSPIDTALLGGAHIHMGYAGENGPVIIPLNISYDADYMGGSFEAANNTFTLSSMEKMALLNRGMYINIHSDNWPAGELRGQVVPVSNYFLQAYLNGAQENPAITSGAIGDLIAEVKGDQLTVSGTFSGLESNFDASIAGGSHIHAAPAGSNGAVKILLNATVDGDNLGGHYMPADNKFTIMPGFGDTLMSRGTYANIHTIDQPAGELRGQFLPEANTYLWGRLSGTSEVPIVNSEASGATILEIRQGAAVLTGSFADLESNFDASIAGGSHIHTALDGSTGGILTGLMANLDGSMRNGVFEAEDNHYMLSAGAIDSLIHRWGYVNIHSMDNAPGELRGQLLPFANAYFTTSLMGMNEVQPIMSDAHGSVKFELNGNMLTLSGSFDDLGTMVDVSIAGGAHLHIGPNDKNGPVAIPVGLSLDGDGMGGDFEAMNNMYELDSMQKHALINEMTYINIHTMGFGGGELRGQVLGEANYFPSDDADITAPMDGAMISLMGDPATVISPAWASATDPDMNELAYIWQVSVTPAFDSIAVNMNVGDANAISLTYGHIDTLLMNLGIPEGGSLMLYHRAVASDGSVHTPGGSATVEFTRNLGVGIEDVVANNLIMKAYPTVSNGQVQVVIESDEIRPNATLTVYSLNGKPVISEGLNLQTGVTLKQLDLTKLPSGSYLVSMEDAGELLKVSTVIVE